MPALAAVERPPPPLPPVSVACGSELVALADETPAAAPVSPPGARVWLDFVVTSLPAESVAVTVVTFVILSVAVVGLVLLAAAAADEYVDSRTCVGLLPSVYAGSSVEGEGSAPGSS